MWRFVVIFNKDSLEYVPTLKDNEFDLAILDPPYCTTNQDWDKEDIITTEFVGMLYDKLTTESSLYLFCGIGEKSNSLLRWMPIFNQFFHFKDILTWKKSRGNGNRRGWLYVREEILWYVKDNKRFIWNKDAQYNLNELRKRDSGGVIRKSNGKYRCRSPYKRHTNVWTDVSEQGKDCLGVNFHYTPKPLQLIDRIICVHTTSESCVLDPFAGSGTTEIVCARHGLSSTSIEKDAIIYSNALKRINNEI